MTELQAKKIENLNLINEWCKANACDEPVIVQDAIWCNNKWYKVKVSSSGIATNGNGTYSVWIPVSNNSDNTLYNQKVGSELIYQWPEVKLKIRSAIRDAKWRVKTMLNFEV